MPAITIFTSSNAAFWTRSSPLTALALPEADTRSLDIPTAANSWWHKHKLISKLYRRTESSSVQSSIRSDYFSIFLCHDSRWLHLSRCKLNPISTNNAIWTTHLCVSGQIHRVNEHNVCLQILHVCFYKRRHSNRRRAEADDVREWVLEKIFGFKRDKITGHWRKIYIEELHDLYC